MSLDRRSFLKAAGAGAGALAFTLLPGATRVLPALADVTPEGAFPYGVASGDPLPDGVIIWTRVVPSPDALPGSGEGGPAVVQWAVATDPELRHVVRRGRVTTSADRDHTVKVDVDGLAPWTRYYYAFTFRGERSAVGSTKTAPATGVTPPDLRFALASCSNYEAGFFTAYRAMAERDDLDFVLHVGDYLYEYEVGSYGNGPAIGRTHEPPHDLVTLQDYRIRYAHYHLDDDLRALHAAHPFVLMWDDHEVANDNWEEGAENHDPETQGEFRDRFDAASQAYREWLPIREHPTDPQRLYRRLEFGQLATLHVIDSRSYRSEQTSYPITPETDPAVDDPDRTMLGREQKDWFKRGLSDSTARWQLVGNPQMIAPVLFPPLPQQLTSQIADLTGLLPRAGVGYNSDQWDGYRAARDEILRHLADEGIDNTVFFTGDIHSSWACDLPLDPGAYPLASPSLAAELVGTSITSDNLDEITGSPARTTSIAVETALMANNRHIKMIEFDSHGFSVVDVTADRVHVDWWYLRSSPHRDRPQEDPDAEVVYGHRTTGVDAVGIGQSWQVLAGTNRVTLADGPLGQRALEGSTGSPDRLRALTRRIPPTSS
jgi:alkaline phosphatase D